MRPIIPCSSGMDAQTNLEQQAAGPIQDSHEMNQDANALVKELLGIPEYVHLFQETFGGNRGKLLLSAIPPRPSPTFERTLLSFNSKLIDMPPECQRAERFGKARIANFFVL